MDVIAQELLETGYLHNHARMWWASFWIHVERLPWELGADFFFRHLLDADPASNTLSWRWVAGLQTVGKTYLVRLSNLQKYAPDYVNGTGTGRECLAAPQVCEPRAEDAVDEGLVPVETYPDSLIFSEARRGLWIHADDLCPEKGPLSMMVPAATSAFLSERVCRERYGLSALRLAALRTALGDGVQRASDHYGCASSLIEDDDPVAALSAWAAAHRLGEIVSMAPMVGPTRDLLPRLRNRLQEQGVRLTLLRRLSDQRVFEGATAGFFPYWQKIKVHLARQLASSDTMKEGIAVSC
jgi:deoxyribodipyrimidine photo-lyase